MKNYIPHKVCFSRMQAYVFAGLLLSFCAIFALKLVVTKYRMEWQAREDALELFSRSKILNLEDGFKYIYHNYTGFARRYSEFCKRPAKELKVALVTVATGRYMTSFFPAFAESAGKHFFRNHNASIFVFSNHDVDIPHASNLPEIHRVWLDMIPWPYSSMMRFGLLSQHSYILREYDYIFVLDVDFVFTHDICEDMLGELVGTIHWQFAGSKGTPDHNPLSSAYIEPGKNKLYYAGGIYGGRASKVLKMAKTLHDNILADLKKDPPIIAEWHDESHLNRYYLDHEPDRILSPEYCWMPYVPFEKELMKKMNVTTKRIEHIEKKNSDSFRQLD